MKSLEQRIIDFHKDRQEPTLRRKYALMASDAFSFYRATCFLFYEDLAKEPAINVGPLTWVCGDLHLENFGSYRAENGLVYFDINDFDEASLAPALWEVSRFLCSIGMASTLWNYTPQEALRLMQLSLKAYATHLQQGKPYAIERETSPALIQDFFDLAEQQKEKDLIKARVDKATEKLKIISEKTILLSEATRDEVKDSLNTFLRSVNEPLQVRDVAFRVAGTGSLGVKRYVALAWDEKKEKWRLLDVKKANHSTLEPHLHVRQPTWKNEAQRIVTVQNYMQYALPRFINTLKMGKEYFVIKQLQPSAQKIDHRLCKGKIKNVETIMITMAEATASAQLRSAARVGSSTVDELSYFSKQKDWQEGLLTLASDYSKAMESYFHEFQGMNFS